MFVAQEAFASSTFTNYPGYYTTDYTSKASTLSSQTVPNFGATTQKAGGDTRRILELSLKYAF
jgi:hypothetical protein